MSDSIFAPLVVKELYVLASDFSIAGSPSENMANKLNIALDDNSDESELAEGMLSLSQTLSVATHLVREDEPEDERMRAGVTVYIRTECKASEDSEEYLDKMREYMRGSSVSIAYGHARTIIASMTAMSPLGSFIIPAIDPVALLQKAKEDERSGE